MRIQSIGQNYQQNNSKTSFGMLEMKPEVFNKLQQQMGYSGSAYHLLDQDFIPIIRVAGIDADVYTKAAKAMPDHYIEFSDIIAILKSENPIETLRTRKAKKITMEMVDAELSESTKRLEKIKSHHFTNPDFLGFLELGESLKRFANLGIENENIPYGRLSSREDQQELMGLYRWDGSLIKLKR